MKRVEQSLQVMASNGLVSLHGLEDLSDAGAIAITDNARLASIAAFAALTRAAELSVERKSQAARVQCSRCSHA